MTVIAAAFATRPDWDPKPVGNALLVLTNRLEELNIESLFDSPGIAAFSLTPHTAAARSRVTVSRPDDATVVVGGPRSSHARSTEIAEQLRTAASNAPVLPHGRWVALRHDAKARTLRVLNDPLGTAWVYLAKVPGGYLMSSNFGALATAFPGTLTVNRAALMAHLAFGHVPTDETCFSEISMLPPGSVVELGPSGMNVLARARPTYGDRHAGLTRDQKFDLLDEAFEHGVRTWSDDDFSDVVLSLSGGLDSPHGLAALLELGIRPRSATWALAPSTNSRVARKLAEKFELDWTLEAPATSWRGWLDWFHVAGTSGFDWGGWAGAWLSSLSAKGSGALIGFLGDALSGKHLVDHPSAGGNWVESWARWSSRDRWLGSPLVRSEIRTEMREVAHSYLQRLADGVEIAYPHQTALHLDLHGRQRRMICSQSNIMARFIAPLPFFYTEQMVTFWSNLPWSDLADQQLYLAHARERYGRVFDVVLGDREVRTLRRSASRLTRDMRLRLANEIPGLRHRIAPVGNDLMGSLLQSRVEIHGLIEAVAPLLEPVLDTAAVLREIERFPRSRLVTSARLHSLLSVAAPLGAA